MGNTNDFNEFGNLVKSLYTAFGPMLLGIVIGASLLLGLWLGLMFIFAGGDEQKVKKAKSSVKYFIIGIVTIFVVAAGLPLIIAAFQNWMAV